MSSYDQGWNDGLDAAVTRAQTLQTGFRGLLKDKRAELKKGVMTRRGSLEEIYAAIDQGEALVGALGDVIRNIAALKRPK